MTQLRKLSRAELWTRLQLTRTVDPMTNKAYEISEERIWKENLDDDPHGHHWHVSFHGSQFPGDDPLACPRQSLYRMMDFPSEGPTSRMLRQTANQGKAVESDLVITWHNAGILLSSPNPDEQTGFEIPEAWLTSSVDAVVLPFGWDKPLPVEIKNRGAEVIHQMQLGRGPFQNHVSQLKVQVAFVRMYQKLGIWLADLEPVTHGMLYYVSRDMPTNTAEFRIDLDENFFSKGVERLKRWRAYFEEDHLPEIKPGKRSTIFGHPNGWRWSKTPCQWCNFKKTCQLDFRAGTTTLSESIGVDRAQKVRSTYDVEAARLRVRARWQEKKNDRDSLEGEQPQETKS